MISPDSISVRPGPSPSTSMLAKLVFAVLVLGACAGGSPQPPESPAALSSAGAEAGPTEDRQSAGTEGAAEPSLELDALLPRDPAVRTGRLDNGLSYYVRRNERPENRAELRLAIDAGSVLEDDDQLGLAHFLEHMAFNGTENFEEQALVDYLESIGMRFGPDLNAYTGFDETVYILQVPTESEETLERALSILSDWAGGLTLDPEEIEKERGVVLEEWRLGRGAGARVRDAQLPVLLRGSRYAERLPIGDPEILESFEPEVLERFYRDWYRPDLMAVIAVGDFDPEEMESAIVEAFAELEGPEEARERFVPEVPEHDETLVSVVSDPELTNTTVAVNWKYRLEPEDRVADYRRSLVEILFNSMLNDRLAELTQAADPPFLGAFSSQSAFNREIGLYSLSAVVESNGVDRGLSTLLREAARARRHGFNESELERAKTRLLRSYSRALEERGKTESAVYASEYVRAFTEDEPFPGIEMEAAIAERYLPTVELDEVDALGERFFDTGNRVVLATLPEAEGIELLEEATLLAMVDRAVEGELEPWVDRVSDRPLIESPPEPAEVVERREVEEVDAVEWTLANGVQVVLKPTDFKNDQIVFSAFSPGGHSLVDDDEWVAAITATGILGLGGVAELDLVELQKKLAGKVVDVSPYIGELEEGLSGSGSPEDLELLFQMIYLVGTSPRCDEEAYASYVSRMSGFLENQRQRPEVVFGEEVARVMSGDHPRRRPMDEELLEETSLDESCEIFRERFADFSDFTFVFVGSFDLASMEPLVERYLGGLPTSGREESWVDVGVEAPEGVVERELRMGLEPRAQVRILFTGDFEQSVQNRYDFRTMQTLLEMRLRETMREELGGTYGVSVGGSSRFEPREEYTLQIGFGCDPERVDELVEVVFEEIARLEAEPVTELELTKLREQQRRQRETALRTNGFWLSALGSIWQHDLDPSVIRTYDERVEGLSEEAIRQAARRYLDTDRYALFVLLPEAGDSIPSDSEDDGEGR